MIVYISREEYYYKGQKDFSTPGHLYIFSGCIPSVKGPWILQKQYYALLAHGSLTSSWPLLPLFVATFCVLSIANGNGLLSLLAKLFASLGKLAHCKLGHGQALQRPVRGKRQNMSYWNRWKMTKLVCKIDDGNISTWTIFHLPPEQVTGKLNITPCVPQNYFWRSHWFRISAVFTFGVE